MTDLKNSVIMPREDFIELSTAAYDNHHVPSAGERIGSTLQNTILFAGIAATVTAGTWGWAMALDWRESRKLRRDMERAQFQKDNSRTSV